MHLGQTDPTNMPNWLRPIESVAIKGMSESCPLHSHLVARTQLTVLLRSEGAWNGGSVFFFVFFGGWVVCRLWNKWRIWFCGFETLRIFVWAVSFSLLQTAMIRTDFELGSWVLCRTQPHLLQTVILQSDSDVFRPLHPGSSNAAGEHPHQVFNTIFPWLHNRDSSNNSYIFV